ncbi:MAG TPA: iron-containing redox enzyme family protein [Gammaproteobacteria bacterium]|nr:iron-containing redox enzyme family protein [Gammaproteobacteria bacterium]
MTFFDQLHEHTTEARHKLLSSTIITDCLARRVSLETYRAFLVQAYHHVRHTVPLLMACGGRLPRRLAWLQREIVHYIVEEQGHEQWISNDIAATGADSAALLAAGPSLATELMVSYAYDTVHRGNPIGFFGMVFVLEGTSVALATRAAGIIRSELGLPGEAFSYLSSHGGLDQEHIANYERIVNRLDEPGDRAAVLHCANVFFELYAGVFAGLPRASMTPGRAVA